MVPSAPHRRGTRYRRRSMSPSSPPHSYSLRPSFAASSSKRDALRGGSPCHPRSMVLFAAPFAALRARQSWDCRAPDTGRPGRHSVSFHSNSPFLPLAELRRAKKICLADRICRTETVNSPKIKSIRESGRRDHGPAARRGSKGSCALRIFPDREQHRFRMAVGAEGAGVLRVGGRRPIDQPVSRFESDASRQEFANLFMGFSLSSSSAGY